MKSTRGVSFSSCGRVGGMGKLTSPSFPQIPHITRWAWCHRVPQPNWSDIRGEARRHETSRVQLPNIWLASSLNKFCTTYCELIQSETRLTRGRRKTSVMVKSRRGREKWGWELQWKTTIKWFWVTGERGRERDRETIVWLQLFVYNSSWHQLFDFIRLFQTEHRDPNEEYAFMSQKGGMNRFYANPPKSSRCSGFWETLLHVEKKIVASLAKIEIHPKSSVSILMHLLAL